MCYCGKDLESEIRKKLCFKGPWRSFGYYMNYAGITETKRSHSRFGQKRNNFFSLCPLITGLEQSQRAKTGNKFLKNLD